MHYAGVLDRFLARLIDAGVIVAAVMVAVVLGFVFSRLGTFGTILNCVTGLALIAGVLGYEIYFLSRDGATIGKKMRNIRVLRSDGSELDMKQSIIRVLSSTFLGIGAIMIFFDEAERKALHDMIADTRVVQA
ncbi:MAG TPA: RDD family protein [Thermoanaerobaculia bacterium]|nr:RDD family protein [Thermoanaerobaculia bacterium]